MRSVFPGVDPFVESQAYWPDFHSTFLNYWREALAEALPVEYEARLDERVNLVDVEAGLTHQIRPDIAVTRASAWEPRAPAGALVIEPETIRTVIMDEDRQGYIKILHRPDRALVAVLELLSPANKSGPGRREYIARRNAILWQDVHLVELDLLLEGSRVPMQQPLPPGDFYAVVSRSEARPDCDVYAWTFRDRLPAIPIPLRSPDPDVWIDLAQVYATAFERGRYARSIHYAEPLPASMTVEAREWASALLGRDK